MRLFFYETLPLIGKMQKSRDQTLLIRNWIIPADKFAKVNNRTEHGNGII